MARGALKLHPESLDFYVTGAYCIRRAGTLDAACDHLRRAQDACNGLLALWSDNVARYESQWGNFDAVGAHFHAATSMDESFKKLGADDEDLRPWFDSM